MQKIFSRKTFVTIFFIFVFALMAWKVYANQDMVRFKVSAVNLPKYFNPVQWSSNGWILGTMSDKFLQMNPENGAWKVLYSEVWSAVCDEQGKVLAFRNAKGLQYVELEKSKKPVLIVTNPNAVINFWSPDGRYLLYSLLDEWSPKYFIYDRVKDASRVYEFVNVENFLSEPIGWKRIDGRDRIVFHLRFSTSKKGDTAYRSAGYRSEFHLADISGRFTPLLEVNDGDYVEYDGFSGDMQKIYFHYYNHRDQIWELDLKTGQKQLRWTVNSGKRIYPAGDWNLAVVEQDLLQLVNLKRNEIIYRFTYEYNRVFWSPDLRKALVLPALSNSVTKGYMIHVQ